MLQKRVYLAKDAVTTQTPGGCSIVTQNLFTWLTSNVGAVHETWRWGLSFNRQVENINSRHFCVDALGEIEFAFFEFNKEEDAAHFMLVWGGKSND